MSYCRLCDRKGWYESQLIVAMPQGYRAKDHVVIKTYTGSARPQSVFDWVARNLASRVHWIKDAETLHGDWYQFQRKSEKVSLAVVVVVKNQRHGKYHSHQYKYLKLFIKYNPSTRCS